MSARQAEVALKDLMKAHTDGAKDFSELSKGWEKVLGDLKAKVVGPGYASTLAQARKHKI